ncbi:MAG: TlpA disulfide reductase family protein [bacterium]|nr:TlpA disulfide reductase family protein [bacterium]
MNIRLNTCISVLLLILLPAGGFAQDKRDGSPVPGAPLEVGSQAPVFTLNDIQGAVFGLTGQIGRSATVLSFWSIYCDSCVDEMLALQKLEDKYRGQDLVIMAVNEDLQVTTDRIRRFLERLEKFRGKITYPLLYDENAKVFNAFGVTSLPTLILIDREGKIAGYHRGFDTEGERNLLSIIEDLASGKTDTKVSAPRIVERSEMITVVGKAALCGFFDESGWRKSFTGNESLEQETVLTRDLAQRDATRIAVSGALRMLGINLFANDSATDCLAGDGIHLDRDPFDTKDSLSKLLSSLSYSDFFETVAEQEMLIDGTWYVSRDVRISIDSLSAELKSIGYLFEPFRITFTYVNMSLLDQKQFLHSLLVQSRFIGRFENPVFTPHSTSQVFEVYTSSQGFSDEILGMDFGKLRVFVEEVTPTSLELEVWK